MKERLILVKPVKNPKISVIITTLNEEKYIEKTLSSKSTNDKIAFRKNSK